MKLPFGIAEFVPAWHIVSVARIRWIQPIESLASLRGFSVALVSALGKGTAPHQRGAAISSGQVCCWDRIAVIDRTKPYTLVMCHDGSAEIAVPAGDSTVLIGPVHAEAMRDGATTLIAEAAAQRAKIIATNTASSLIGDSGIMQTLRSTLSLVSDSDASIVILGENGTGKELVAKQIHDQSARASGPYIAANCSAFNDNLLDSELFGHIRGAFTGATSDRQGLLEMAHGGTFFLDEIGDMSPALQVKLLRVLQEGTFYRVGSNESRHGDVRIIAATNRDLGAMVRRGEFREDLFYRLNVITVRVPALRDRTEDIAQLCAVFLARLTARNGYTKAIAAECMAAMQAYRWPGNVRELENEMERMYVLSGDAEVIGNSHLSPRITGIGSEATVAVEATSPGFRLPEATNPGITIAAGEHSLPKVIESTERMMIRDSLLRHGGNKTRAAAELEISRRNLIRLAQKYDLNQLRRS